MSSPDRTTHQLAPAGYVDGLFWPDMAMAVARKVRDHRGHLVLGTLEEAYAYAIKRRHDKSFVEQMSLSKSGEPGGWPQSMPRGRPGLFALAMALWRQATDRDCIDRLHYEALREALLMQAPETLFAEAYWDGAYARGGGEELVVRHWLCPAEVLLASAALLEQRQGAGPEVRPLLQALDQARPQWQAEHTANWSSERRRAVLGDAQFARRLAGADWEAAFRVLAGTASALSRPNAAQLVYRAIQNNPDLGAPAWAAIAERVRAGGLTEDDVVLEAAATVGKASPTWPYLRLGEEIDKRLHRDNSAQAGNAAFWRHQMLAAQLTPRPGTPTAATPSL